MSTLRRQVTAPRGTTRTCRESPQEAALRRLMNHLDPAVARRPDDDGGGIGSSIHAGLVVVAGATRDADEQLQRVLTCNAGMGIVRHADAGDLDALAAARRHRLDLPTALGGRPS
jgi:urocanate hydratase